MAQRQQRHTVKFISSSWSSQSHRHIPMIGLIHILLFLILYQFHGIQHLDQRVLHVCPELPSKALVFITTFASGRTLVALSSSSSFLPNVLRDLIPPNLVTYACWFDASEWNANWRLILQSRKHSWMKAPLLMGLVRNWSSNGMYLIDSESHMTNFLSVALDSGKYPSTIKV